MLKISLLFKKLHTSQVNNSRILRIKNAKLSGFCFYIHKHIGRFQICISVPLRKGVIRNFPNSQENNCTRVSFLKDARLRKKFDRW